MTFNIFSSNTRFSLKSDSKSFGEVEDSIVRSSYDSFFLKKTKSCIKNLWCRRFFFMFLMYRFSVSISHSAILSFNEEFEPQLIRILDEYSNVFFIFISQAFSPSYFNLFKEFGILIVNRNIEVLIFLYLFKIFF